MSKIFGPKARGAIIRCLFLELIKTQGARCKPQSLRPGGQAWHRPRILQGGPGSPCTAPTPESPRTRLQPCGLNSAPETVSGTKSPAHRHHPHPECRAHGEPFLPSPRLLCFHHSGTGLVDLIACCLSPLWPHRPRRSEPELQGSSVRQAWGQIEEHRRNAPQRTRKQPTRWPRGAIGSQICWGKWFRSWQQIPREERKNSCVGKVYCLQAKSTSPPPSAETRRQREATERTKARS